MGLISFVKKHPKMWAPKDLATAVIYFNKSEDP